MLLMINSNIELLNNESMNETNDDGAHWISIGNLYWPYLLLSDMHIFPADITINIGTCKTSS